MTRVLIVDDHAFVRTGLTALLNAAHGIDVVLTLRCRGSADPTPPAPC